MRFSPLSSNVFSSSTHSIRLPVASITNDSPPGCICAWQVLGPMSEKIESENSYYRRAMIATAAVVAVPAVAFIGYRMTRS